MLFNSWEFLVFLPVLWLAWLWAGPRARRNLMLVASYAFYAGGDWRFVPLLALSTVVDWVAGHLLDRTDARWARRSLLAASLAVNLGVLFAFKYLPFLLASVGVEGWSEAGQAAVFHVEGNIPPGLSFYTFQTLSYTLDVYRRRSEHCRSFWDFAVYVAFFPQLIAGPILRSHEFLPQLRANRTPTPADIVQGVELFGLGLFKKVVIADNIGLAVDDVFGDLPAYDGPTVALACLLFSAQVYCDFSGYSTMARGVGRLFGFVLPKNFDYPWLQGSPLGYRRAWHITTGTWFRDYVYFPMGGSQGSELRTSFNLMVVWVLFGIWHGAGWTFMFWGLYNGVVQVIWRMVARHVEVPAFPGRRWAAILLNAAFLVPSSMFFRASSVSEGLAALASAATLSSSGQAALGSWWVLLAVLLGLHILAFLRYDENLLNRLPWAGRAVVVGAAAVAMVALAADQRPFIYFQF